MSPKRIVIVGGGAAGFFAAIAAAEKSPGAEIVVLEKTSQFLSKVRISGGGRCNVTHACFDGRDFATRFPRGERALIAPFTQFQAADTVKWFAERGVKLKTESDGRMFPTTDSSRTIIDCLLAAALRGQVKLKTNCGVERVAKRTDGRFEVTMANDHDGRVDLPAGPGAQPRVPAALTCDKLLLATGGCRTAAQGQLAVALGHTLEPPVPSLFTFHIATPWLRELAGVSVDWVEVSVPGSDLREHGPLLVTHSGLSGPSILRLSAWGARKLHEMKYEFPLRVNWLPHLNAEKLAAELAARRESQPARLLVNAPIAPLPMRLWEKLVLATGITGNTRCSALSKGAQHKLAKQLHHTEYRVAGKSLNKDEFVTCGGVRLSEVNFKTMESRICPGLFFAGELLDLDGITGGFNFQAAWTTGWIAGRAMAQ